MFDGFHYLILSISESGLEQNGKTDFTLLKPHMNYERKPTTTYGPSSNNYTPIINPVLTLLDGSFMKTVDKTRPVFASL